MVSVAMKLLTYKGLFEILFKATAYDLKRFESDGWQWTKNLENVVNMQMQLKEVNVKSIWDAKWKEQERRSSVVGVLSMWRVMFVCVH
jgi:hypothetical protein